MDSVSCSSKVGSGMMNVELAFRKAVFYGN